MATHSILCRVSPTNKPSISRTLTIIGKTMTIITMRVQDSTRTTRRQTLLSSSKKKTRRKSYHQRKSEK